MSSEYTSLDLPVWGWALWLAVFLAGSVVGVYWDYVRALGVHLGLRRGIRRHPARLCLAACLCGALMVGAVKGPGGTSALVQFVTALSSGLIIDPSGTVGRASDMVVVDAYVQQAADSANAASGTVAVASVRADELALLITGEQRRVIYIASDVPRTDPQAHTNSNIAANIEKVQQNADGSVLSQWVWYSEDPATNPTVVAEIDVGGGWVRLEQLTNTWPTTESINGADCVRYDFAVPAEARGVVFRPTYEMAFGGPDTPLIVPIAGITVTTNDVERYPFTGEDWYDADFVVGFFGGIATGAVVNGQACTNGGIYEVEL